MADLTVGFMLGVRGAHLHKRGEVLSECYSALQLDGAGQMHPTSTCYHTTPREQKRDLLATVGGFTNTWETAVR